MAQAPTTTDGMGKRAWPRLRRAASRSGERVGRCRALALALPIVLGVAHATQAVEVGDAAPPLTVKTWLAGQPLDLAKAKGRLVIVEWWATWCADSRKQIPRLNRLQRLHGDELDVVAVTDEGEAAVRKLLAERRVRYRVALDKGVTSKKAWMRGIVGTPYAFLVGRDGKIAWQGDPAIGLYPAVHDLLAGKFDPERYEKLNKSHRQLTYALKAGDAPETLRLLDEMIATVPEDAWAYQLKLAVLRKQQKYAAARETCIAMAKRCTSDPDALEEAADLLSTANALFLRDMPLALQLAQQAAELTRREEPDILATVARCHYELGHLARAIEVQAKAVQAAPEGEDEVLAATLHFYRMEQTRRSGDPEAK